MKNNKVTLFAILFGGLNSFCELAIRIFDSMWRYKLYYLIPVRAHVFLVAIALGLIVYIVHDKKSHLCIKWIGISINIIYILLWINTWFNT